MKKIEIKMVPDKFNAWYVFAVFVDGECRYKTGNAKSVYDYCKRHFGIELPIETGWKSFEGLKKTDDVLSYEI